MLRNLGDSRESADQGGIKGLTGFMAGSIHPAPPRRGPAPATVAAGYLTLWIVEKGCAGGGCLLCRGARDRSNVCASLVSLLRNALIGFSAGFSDLAGGLIGLEV